MTEEQVAVVKKFIKEGKLNGLELEEKLDYSFKANKQKCGLKEKYFKIRLEVRFIQFFFFKVSFNKYFIFRWPGANFNK